MPDRIGWISTNRVGQLTGSSSTHNPVWPFAEDPIRKPLLTDTGRWGVLGVDMGANTEHSDGRLYIFFGDVATEQDKNKKYSHGITVHNDNPVNSDLIGWTDTREILHLGGHRPLGWTFILPNDHQGGTPQTGQEKWRFCNKCHGIFWAPRGVAAGVCPRGGAHNPIGWGFFLPNDHQGATDSTGQKNWRFCDRCNGLFWSPDRSPAGTCPAGGTHNPAGWVFYLPNLEQGANPATGQKDWRFCAGCHGLFWDGEAHKGVCSAATGGGGFQLQAVLGNDGLFAPFALQEPYGLTESLEVPSGAFSHAGRVYVFTNISEWKYSGKKRPVDPFYGNYLVSNHHPGLRGRYEMEFMFNPRIGWCPKDHTRQFFESHEVRGVRFVLPHSRSGAPSHQENWRYCGKCHTLFREGASPSLCWKGGHHEPVPGGLHYTLPFGIAEDTQNQSNWHQCGKCASLFWNGDTRGNTGLCPGGDAHVATGTALVIPHATAFPAENPPDLDFDEFHEDAFHQPNWRFCGKCGGLFFWDDDPAHTGSCPKGGGHEAWGLTFVLHHEKGGVPIAEDAHNQKNWLHCKKCHGLFWDGDHHFNGDHHFKGVCPADGQTHDSQGKSFNFVLHHDQGADSTRQPDWHYCTKCAGLFWKGDPNFGGFCKADNRPHHPMGFNFVLPHNPGQDPQNQAGWRFCAKCFSMVSTNQYDVFPGVAPVVVHNAEHSHEPGLPEREGAGVVMFSKGFWRGPNADPGMRLAWMPLRGAEHPRLQDVRYYTGLPGDAAWSADPNETANLFKLPKHWSSVSALWLKDVRRWIIVYCDAEDKRDDLRMFERPVYARISPTPWGFGVAEQIEIFNPWREGAYGTYANKPGFGTFPVDYPPLPPPIGGIHGGQPENFPGWAYGAFLLERFTHWDPPSRVLNLHYLLSLGRPYQVQLMNTRIRIVEPVNHLHLFYAGNGLTFVDSGLPFVGLFYGVAENGDLRWYRYNGHGESDPSGSRNWHQNSGHAIGNGWQNFKHLLGCGDGVILGVHEDGGLYWYSYDGNGEHDPSGAMGWHPNSGNVIGNGWQNFRHIFVSARAGRPPGRLTVYAVAQNGDLLWYSYDGDGTHDPSGATGWHPNSGNVIGNGWQNFRHLHASGSVIFGVHENGDLLWYSYHGKGEHDPAGSQGWAPNSGNAIGNGWLGFRHIFGGTSDTGGFGHVLYGATPEGKMLWYKYIGDGEADHSGNTGWVANSRNEIGNGW